MSRVKHVYAKVLSSPASRLTYSHVLWNVSEHNAHTHTHTGERRDYYNSETQCHLKWCRQLFLATTATWSVTGYIWSCTIYCISLGDFAPPLTSPSPSPPLPSPSPSPPLPSPPLPSPPYFPSPYISCLASVCSTHATIGVMNIAIL